jgi:very-short-patch-repair endonuclease
MTKRRARRRNSEVTEFARSQRATANEFASDGKHHFTDAGISADRERDRYLGRLGYKVLRVPGYEILRDPDLVRRKIGEAIVEIRGS